MKNILIALALLFSTAAFAGCGDWNGYSYNRCGPDDYGHGHRSAGRELIEVGIGGAIAIAAVQVGAAVGGRIAQGIAGTSAQQSARVVYATCDRTPFINGGLVYADRCDGLGPVVVGRIDRR